MMGDLSKELIGADPKYPKIVDHSWLEVDTSTYDNYPSDNQPLRTIPKLHDLWNHGAQQGVSIIPNSQVLPLGIRSSTEDSKTGKMIVREAKKAIMAGLKGHQLTSYLRSRFSAKHIDLAKDELQKVASEIGLLGNVYIDVTAFETYGEAEQFLKQHKTRLARDVLLNEGYNPYIVSMLASEFHKNCVASVDYNENLFKKYHDHLVQAGRIPNSFVIDSKDSLRAAFLYVAPKPDTTVKAQEEKKIFTAEEITAGLNTIAAEQSLSAREAQDAIQLHIISPVVSFVQEYLAKGKNSAAIKEMVQDKFAFADLKVAAQALSIVLAKEGLDSKKIDALISAGDISTVLGEELKRIGRKYPVVQAQKFEPTVKSARSPAGISGFMYAMTGKQSSDKNDTYKSASLEALKRGIEPEKIHIKLCQKFSADEADSILAAAVTQLNAQPAGAIANKKEKSKNAVIFPDPITKPTLPDPSTIESATQEILSYTTGNEMVVDVNSLPATKQIEVGELFNRAGIDSL
jgi:hypothetical protein